LKWARRRPYRPGKRANEMSEFLLKASLVLLLLLFVIQTFRLRRARSFEDFYGASEKQEKMATLGHLLAGIAHELRTPLGAVSCSLDTDRRAVGKMVESLGHVEKSTLDDTSRAELKKALKALNILQASEPVLDQALERTGQLVRQLRLAGRGDMEEPVAVGVNGLIEGTLVLLNHELKHDVVMDMQLGEIPDVQGWAGPLGQVFLNLILNAQQALDGPGTITVSSMVAGDTISVTVSDTGPGFPGTSADRLFEPGWSTKSEDEGTGLGLFISRRIVERHGGKIVAENREGGGASFTVTLPVAAEGTAEAGA
jgi:two-component system NtrC family sensor kinase